MYRLVMIPLLTSLLCLSGSGCGEKDSGSGSGGSDSGSKDTEKQADADIAKLLVGQWEMEKTNEVGVKAISTLDFSTDETFTSEMKTTFAVKGKPDPSQPIELSASGTWKVVDGMVELTFMKTNTNSKVKGGQQPPYVQRSAVHSITESTLKLGFGKGANGDPYEVVYNRVNANK